jgi:endonuclease I
VQRLETVKRWAREEPVSDHEKHRNWTIHTAQKNRNPFVDHPEWIDRIDFSIGLG